MSKLTALIRRAPKRFSAVVAMIAAAIIIPTAAFAWGPTRDTYTVQNPADHITFNSITNNPNIGDERNFVGIREVGSANVWYDDVTVQPGKEYYVRMYVHNNAAANLNLVAENVTAKFNLPTTTGKSVEVAGFLSASNASPREVYDHATFNSTQDFNVAYVPGSLIYENNVFGSAGTPLPESIFTSAGAKLGYDKLDGKIPGCFQYAGYVGFKVKAQVAPTNTFEVSKLARKHGATNWVESVAAQPGEKVDFLISYRNTGGVQQNDVTFRDTLPTGLTYVPGSTKWYNASHQGGVATSDNLTNGVGINVGSYAPGANAWVIFSATVNGNDALPNCGPNTLVNAGKVTTGGGSITDNANVTVDKSCKPDVQYTCDALAITRINRTDFRFNTTYTVKNATFKNVTYIIRDASGNEVERKTSTNTSLDYSRTVVGKYTVEAVITVTVDGQDKTVSSDNCKKEFEVPSTPDYCPIPGKEYLPKDSPDCKDTPLPHTGAENIVALLGLGALIASIAYYVASRRALS